MRLNNLYFFVAALAPGALAAVAAEAAEVVEAVQAGEAAAMWETCRHRTRTCHWEGSSPFCGKTSSQIGEWSDDRYQLATWTKFDDVATICSSNDPNVNPGQECCRIYGKGCVTGYKRLWCEPQ